MTTRKPTPKMRATLVALLHREEQGQDASAFPANATFRALCRNGLARWVGLGEEATGGVAQEIELTDAGRQAAARFREAGVTTDRTAPLLLPLPGLSELQEDALICAVENGERDNHAPALCLGPNGPKRVFFSRRTIRALVNRGLATGGTLTDLATFPLTSAGIAEAERIRANR